MLARGFPGQPLLRTATSSRQLGRCPFIGATCAAHARSRRLRAGRAAGGPRALAFGMRCSPTTPSCRRRRRCRWPLAELLATSDFVSLHARATRPTRPVRLPTFATMRPAPAWSTRLGRRSSTRRRSTRRSPRDASAGAALDVVETAPRTSRAPLAAPREHRHDPAHRRRHPRDSASRRRHDRRRDRPLRLRRAAVASDPRPTGRWGYERGLPAGDRCRDRQLSGRAVRVDGHQAGIGQREYSHKQAPGVPDSQCSTPARTGR